MAYIVFAALLSLMCFLRLPLAAQQSPVNSPEHTQQNTRTCPRPQSHHLWPNVVVKCVERHEKCACTKSDAAKKYVITKDISSAKPDAVLIIPTEKVTGIEDNAIFQAPYLNFWKYGLEEWNGQNESIGCPGPRTGHTTGLAINAQCARTDGQLHIHISCVLPQVLRTLKENDSAIGYAPASPHTLPGMDGIKGAYRVIKIKGLTDENSPFEIVRNFPGAKDDMADEGIAVIPAPKPGEYYVLDSTYKDGHDGGAEELLDQTCTLR